MEIRSIQHLRALAALMVVVFHLHPQLARMGYEGAWPDWLSNGVDIFFVISGFIMWSTTAGRPVTPMDFYRRRIVRIVPLYWLITSVVVAVMLAAPRLLQTARFDLSHVLASYAFIAWPSPAGHVEPVLVPGWTLNYEMFFYLLFGLALLLPERRRLAATGLVLAALAAVGWWLRPASPAAGFYTSDIMLEFLAGMMLGRLYAGGEWPARSTAGWLLALAGLALLAGSGAWPAGTSRLLQAGLPSILIVAGALAIERAGRTPSWPLLHRVGDASYSLYLIHPLALSALSQAWRKAGLGGTAAGMAAFCLVAVAVSALAGLACHRLVERPLGQRLARRRLPAVRATTG